MKEEMNFVQSTLANLGHAKVAKACRVTRQAVKQWAQNGRLPDTEQLPKCHPRRSNHSDVIAKMARCSKSELLKE